MNFRYLTKILTVLLCLVISLELAASEYTFSDDDYDVNWEWEYPVNSESEEIREYEQFRLELGKHFGFVDNTRVRDSSSENNNSNTNSDELYINSIFLQLLIFVCCAAGVFGFCILCCIVCGQIFDSNYDASTEQENLAYINNQGLQIHRNGNDDSILTFISIHRNPWSPGLFDEEQQAFRFGNGGYVDKPPPYEDLDLTKKSEEPDSPPPPPYTPSFCLTHKEIKTKGTRKEETCLETEKD